MTIPTDTDTDTASGLDPVAGTVFEAARAEALEELTGVVGRVKACTALGVSRATYYRRHRRSPAAPRPPRRKRRRPRALDQAEEARSVGAAI
ncbi:hypothetical protein [Streptomyces sioyaensis]|uniref:hypothetical protein n=1 Tax=Streptomyces sioyaensis TaxID=67364 RepID=UPI003F540256